MVLPFKTIPLFVLIFFLMFSSSVKAYELFTANPYFNDGNGVLPYGVILYNPIYNNTFYYNATCSGLTNCVIIENNGSNQHNSLWFQGLDWLYTGSPNPQWSNLTSLLEFNSDNEQAGIPYLYTFVPKNQDGILIFNYRWNYTLTTPIPYLSILDSNGNSVLLLYLNATPNIWHNVSQIINSSASDRYLTLRMVWYWDNLPTRLEMDKFKFYTVDLIEAGNVYHDFDYYCGGNSINVCGTKTSTIEGTYTTLGLTADIIPCFAIKTGNITFSGRVLSNESHDNLNSCNTSTIINCRAGLYETKYGYLFHAETQGGSCNWNLLWFIESLSLTNAKVTDLRTGASLQNYTAYGGNQFSYTDGNGVIDWSKTMMPYISIYPNYSRETVNINITPTFASGIKWRFRNADTDQNGLNSSWHDFFSYGTIYCTAKNICDESINYQYYQSSDCDTFNYRWCGNCYCNSDLTGCDYPSVIGSYCDTTDTSNKAYITNFDNCTSLYSVCGNNQKCNQYTLTVSQTDSTPYYTISCYNTQTAVHDFCIDTLGNNVSCSSIDTRLTNITNQNVSTSTDVFVNPANSLASTIGGFFGIKNMGLSQNITSIILSLLISVLVGATLGKYGKIKGSGLMSIFFMTNIMMLIVFTIISWFNPFIMVILLIISGFIVVKTSGAFGGD